MRIVIAPDSFKGSLSSAAAAECIGRGVLKVFPQAEIIKIPMADGGEGTVEALVSATGGRLVEQKVMGPLGQKVNAVYGILDDGTAIIEMAAASGLTLIPEEKRNPMTTTSYGTGELIKAALDSECSKILIGIGGSATNDGGMGMAQALGAKFLDESGKDLGFGGGELGRLDCIDISGLDSRLNNVEMVVACDVSNPLCGENGASFVYGPQKGADAEEVSILDKNLKHYAQIIREQLGKDIIDVPGAGAAGGLGAGLMVFLNAKLKSGIETVMDIVHMDNHLQGADLVITGEGKIDGQSIYGKVPVGVAQYAKRYHIPVLAVVGGIDKGASLVYEYGIDSIMSIIDKAMPLEQSMKDAAVLMEDSVERAMRMIRIGMKKSKPTL